MVASMPMVSPVGRETPREEYFDAADNVAATDDDGHLDTKLAGRDQVVGNPVDGWLGEFRKLGCRQDTRPRA